MVVPEGKLSEACLPCPLLQPYQRSDAPKEVGRSWPGTCCKTACTSITCPYCSPVMDICCCCAGQPDTFEATYSFFLGRVRDRLHVCLCFSPVGPQFARRQASFCAFRPLHALTCWLPPCCAPACT